jgi:hypothetical protein
MLPLLWYALSSSSEFAYQSVWSLGSWLAACLVLYDKTPTYGSEPFGWAWTFAWGYLFGVLRVLVPPDMPWGWYVFWMPTMAISAVFMCQDRTAWQLIIWTTAMFVLRFFVYAFYLFYIVNPVKWRIFPFNLFSQSWQASKPRWYARNVRELDTIRDTKLCERCNKIVGKSSLIVGSRWPVTMMVEWHDFGSKESFWMACKPKDQQHSTDQQPLTQSSEEAEQSVMGQLPISQSTGSQSISEQCLAEQPTEQPAKKIQLLGGSSCSLCNLLWYSMSAKRRTTESFGVLKDPKPGLRLKIWEERPLTLYTYVQLFWGEVPLGTRILVHREQIFAKR